MRHDSRPVEVAAWTYRLPRAASPRCGFCGLRAHGTRSGIIRCVSRARHLARALEVPHVVAKVDDRADRFVYPYRSALEVLGINRAHALDAAPVPLIPCPHDEPGAGGEPVDEV